MIHVADHEETVECSTEPRRSVLNRAASIMEAFTGTHRVLSLNELSRRSKLPKSTAHRFAEQLLELGWLERELEGYRVGMRLFEVGSLAERRNKLRDKALPHMHKLSIRTGMAVNLGILDGHEVLYLERIPGQGLDLPTRDGGRMPASCTGLGKALLAFGSAEDVELACAAGLPRLTRSSIVDPDRLTAEMERIRAAGVAYDHEEACPKISCVAAPIRGSGKAIAAISATAVTGEFDEAAVAVAIRNTTAAIWLDMFPRSRYAS